MKRTVSRLVAGLCGLAVCVPAAAAVFPQAVERGITLTGPAALSLGELLGFSPAASSVSLRLGPPVAWAVYQLKQDTKERLWNDNEGSPARYDVFEFSPAPVPSITISPYWLDLATRAPMPEAGAYSFESPFLPEGLPGSEPWTQLVKRLKAGREWAGDRDKPYQRCFTSADRVQLCVWVVRKDAYPDNKKLSGYVVVIEAHLPGH